MLLLSGVGSQNFARSISPEKAFKTVDAVFVAPPTGERENDRASIHAALEEVEPGGTVLFAPGTYLVEKMISVTISNISLLGHPEGTIIRGCEPEKMEDLEFAVVNCNGLELAGSNQIVSGFIFEYAYWALHLGCCRNERIMYELPDGTSSEGSAIYNTGGGHLVENNTFRFSNSGIRMNGDWEEPAIVKNNRFINNWHGVSINGNTVHLFDNSFSVPEPEKIPAYEFAWDAVKIGPPLPMQGVEETYFREGSGNIISNNKIEGSHQGISIAVYEPGTSCRNNLISNNTINIRRGKVLAPENFSLNHEFDSTFVGVPIALLNFPDALGYNVAGQESYIENNLIEGNEIIGAEGLGIEILHSSSNRIINNKINAITVRNPFPGNIMDPRNDALEWSEANGSGIWVSPRSDGNEITGNTFKDIASYAVFIEGDGNKVEVESANKAVRNSGTRNRISTKIDSVDTLYESKFVEARGIRLQYMDFGGEGLPIIFLQDFHDYFYEGSESPSFYASFTGNHRVLAPYARGWGESDKTGWGYDVATQSEDILGFMDALGIRCAVLAGRTGGDHDMTWIAEHHPERVAGLIYYDNLRIFPDLRDPIVRSFVEMTWFTCHMGEESVARLGPRSAWRPHFLYDESATINIPAIRFFAPEFHQNSRSLSVLGRVEQRGSEAASRCADQATLDEYTSLSKDKERVATLRKALKAADLTSRANRAMERAFGNYMTTIMVQKEEEYSLEFQIPHIENFLEKVKTIERGKSE